MQQQERLSYLIEYLWREAYGEATLDLPESDTAQWEMYRGVANIRPPQPISEMYLNVQYAFLQTYNNHFMTTMDTLSPSIGDDVFLWQGDITQLKVDAIVNAANSRLLGCFEPNHNCIDNIIHTKAGVQLRLACHELMEQQGKKEGIGKAKITSGYNLPAQHVIHTVGPQIHKLPVSNMNKDLLARSYRSCLEIAEQHHLDSIAFCCISTGVFGFPQVEAAKIAIDTVLAYKKEHNIDMNIIFNVYTDTDAQLYKEELKRYD